MNLCKLYSSMIQVGYTLNRVQLPLQNTGAHLQYVDVYYEKSHIDITMLATVH